MCTKVLCAPYSKKAVMTVGAARGGPGLATFSRQRALPRVSYKLPALLFCEHGAKTKILIQYTQGVERGMRDRSEKRRDEAREKRGGEGRKRM